MFLCVVWSGNSVCHIVARHRRACVMPHANAGLPPETDGDSFGVRNCQVCSWALRHSQPLAPWALFGQPLAAPSTLVMDRVSESILSKGALPGRIFHVMSWKLIDLRLASRVFHINTFRSMLGGLGVKL